ncbi:MAG: response regulator transcription factor [Syntrophobacterales bacterium]|jgi:DNA-binding NarL/FixJ family response regulator
MSIRIIIADDHQIVRQGLKLLLEKESDMEVVGEAEDGRSTVTLARDLTPDIVLMDVKMPEMNGIEASHLILSELPDVKVIALSMYSDRRFVIDMLKAGAHGYLLKDCAFEELAQAIRLVMAKKTYLSPGIAEIVVKDYVTLDSRDSQSVFSALTPREREVLQMIAEGKRTSQIANLLHISIKTVDTHRQQIMSKLKTRSVAELTKYAIREGLITLDD